MLTTTTPELKNMTPLNSEKYEAFCTLFQNNTILLKLTNKKINQLDPIFSQNQCVILIFVKLEYMPEYKFDGQDFCTA